MGKDEYSLGLTYLLPIARRLPGFVQGVLFVARGKIRRCYRSSDSLIYLINIIITSMAFCFTPAVPCSVMLLSLGPHMPDLVC